MSLEVRISSDFYNNEQGHYLNVITMKNIKEFVKSYVKKSSFHKLSEIRVCLWKDWSNFSMKIQNIGRNPKRFYLANENFFIDFMSFSNETPVSEIFDFAQEVLKSKDIEKEVSVIDEKLVIVKKEMNKCWQGSSIEMKVITTLKQESVTFRPDTLYPEDSMGK